MTISEEFVLGPLRAPLGGSSPFAHQRGKNLAVENFGCCPICSQFASPTVCTARRATTFFPDDRRADECPSYFCFKDRGEIVTNGGGSFRDYSGRHSPFRGYPYPRFVAYGSRTRGSANRRQHLGRQCAR